MPAGPQTRMKAWHLPPQPALGERRMVENGGELNLGHGSKTARFLFLPLVEQSNSLELVPSIPQTP